MNVEFLNSALKISAISFAALLVLLFLNWFIVAKTLFSKKCTFFFILQFPLVILANITGWATIVLAIIKLIQKLFFA